MALHILEKKKKYTLNYKGNIQRHKYKSDFIIEAKIILEIKAIECLTSSHINIDA